MSTKQLSVRFSHNVDLLIQRAANELGISFSEWVRRAYEEAVC